MVKSVIFDFDCTLTTMNVSNLLNSKNIDKVFGNDCDLKWAIQRIMSNLQTLGTYKNGATQELVQMKTDTLLDLLRAKSLGVKAEKLNVNLGAFKEHISSDIVQNIIINLFWGGQSRLDQINEMLLSLKNKKIIITISSHGELPLIIGILKIVNLYHYFNFIHTSGYGIISDTLHSLGGKILPTYRFKMMSKADFIKTLILYEKYTSIIYIDDLQKEFQTLIHPFNEQQVAHPNKSVAELRLCQCQLYFITSLKPESEGIQKFELELIKNLTQIQ